MTKKKAKCPKCCPDGGAIFTRSIDEDGNSVWRCNNCFYEIVTRKRERPTEESPLTPSQIRSITKIQQYRLREGNKIEVKQFKVRQMGSFVSVVVEVGNKGDEGTLGSIYCRLRGHFFVGRNGKITAVDVPDAAKANAKKYPLIYGWQ